MLLVACAAALPATTEAAAPSDGYRFAVSLVRAGPRPAGSAAERSAQLRVARVFDRSGLSVEYDRFRVPGKGVSRNVIGIHDIPASCLVIVMAHSDSTPGSPGAVDNGSGLGALVDFAPSVLALNPPCDIWLVATGAEERVYTGRPDHLGASALVRRLKHKGRERDLRLALSLDEVGRGTRMWLRSSARAPRARVERAVTRAARGTGLNVAWVRDAGSGNSDHREFQIRGLPAAKLGATSYAYRHTPRDSRDKLTAGTFPRVRRLLEALVG
jgi:Zn-dependent M28 family amino/carboxypeptidase